jgi:hypothetical protein
MLIHENDLVNPSLNLRFRTPLGTSEDFVAILISHADI